MAKPFYQYEVEHLLAEELFVDEVRAAVLNCGDSLLISMADGVLMARLVRIVMRRARIM